MELKYVIDEYGNFAIFSKIATHLAVARTLNGKAVGAGFCNIRQKADSADVNIHCYGRSISLGIESRIEDGEIINSKL